MAQRSGFRLVLLLALGVLLFACESDTPGDGGMPDAILLGDAWDAAGTDTWSDDVPALVDTPAEDAEEPVDATGEDLPEPADLAEPADLSASDAEIPDTQPTDAVSTGNDVPASADVVGVLPAENEIDGCALLLVTTEDMRAAFEPLAEWRRQTGLSVRVVTMETIEADAETPDRAAALRDAIREATDSCGARIVLLGGDSPLVPARIIPMATEIGDGMIYSHASEAAAELYYGDLDGDWDGDGDGVFGEFEDDLDMVPDVAVGRVPVDGPADAAAYVEKVIAYENAAADDYQQRVLFISEATGYGDLDAAVLLDRWSRSPFGNAYDIEKLYDSSDAYPDAAPNTLAAQSAAIEAGKGIVVHLGHGSDGRVAALYENNIRALDNGPRTNIFLSCACYGGNFTVSSGDAAGELYVTTPADAGVAYVGNTDVGIGFPPGALILKAMLDALLLEEITPRLGEALDTARMNFVDGGGGTWTELHEDRYTQMVVVLLGDPSLRMWRRTPRDVKVTAPETMAADGSVLLHVTDEDGLPVAGVTVTAYQPGQMLHVQRSDDAGRVLFSALDAVSGTIDFTLSGADVRPQQFEISVP